MIIDVIPNKRLPRGIGDTFSYNVPEELADQIKPGQLVRVDFRNKLISALVKAVRPDSSDPSLKPILKLLSAQPLVMPVQMRLAVWVANYYFTSLATATKLIIPDIPLKSKHESLKLKKSKKPDKPKKELIWWDNEVEKVKQINDEINKTLKAKQQVLHLFPEFYLAERKLPPLNSPLSIGGTKGGILWKNTIGKKEGLEQWLKVMNQKNNYIVGTRSALFAPYQNLGLIIIEDEANGLYKSEITPRYHSREVAKKLAELHGAKLIITSPAPSLETYESFCQPEPVEGRQKNNSKKTSTLRQAQGDRINIIDIKEEREQENYSSLAQELQTDIAKLIKENKKVFLFLNRRGHSANTICQDCGHTFLCPDCRLPMRYHTNFNNLVCHHCRHRQELPPFCPKCSKPNLKLTGKGTQKLEQETNKLFPGITTYRLDSDVEKIDQKGLKKAQIIIGTEFAFSGARIDWSYISLIAALNADTALYRPDYRATERTYQQIMAFKQLNSKAQVYVQTYNPGNLAIKAIAENDPDIFYKEELKIRQALGYPPYQDLIKLIYRNSNEKKTVGEAMHIYNRLRKHLILSSRPSGASGEISATSKYNETSRQARGDNDVLESDKTYPIEILRPFPAFERKELGKFKFHLILKIAPDAPEELYKKIRELVPADWVFDRDPETLL